MHTVRVPLGNPCAGIRRTAETPRNRPLQPAELGRLPEARYLNREEALPAADRILQVIQDFLNISHLPVDKLVLNEELFNLPFKSLFFRGIEEGCKYCPVYYCYKQGACKENHCP